MPPMTQEEMEEEQQALALLSPEERAAMAEDEEDVAVLNKLAAEADDDEEADKTDDKDASETDDGDEEDGDDDNESDEEADALAKQNESANSDDPAENAAKADTKTDTIPLDLTPVNQQYEAQLAALDQRKAEQFKLLMDGEITAEEYAKVESQYMRDRDAARDSKLEAESWFRDVHAFKSRVLKEDGINYQTDPEKAAAWDDWVKRLANNPANAAKDGAWFLEQAHKKVLIEFADVIGKKATPAAPADKNVARNKGRAPKLDAIPPTLGGIPAAAETEAGDDGEFAHLDKLAQKGGMEFERALARLTPDQKDRYERGN